MVQPRSDRINLKKICAAILVGYIFLMVSFYFLAGHQLRFRDSRGDVDMPSATSGSVELVSGATVEQTFTTEIQRIEQISVQWGTYGHQNAGTAVVEVYNLNNHSLLMSKKVDVAKITERSVTVLSANQPIEGLCNVPLMIRITSPDSVTGGAVSPMMSLEGVKDGYRLSLNGKPVNGTLCFSATGEDYIWIGLHYWQFVLAFGFLLLLYLLSFLSKVKKGKRSLLLNVMVAVKKYRFLIHQLVSRDFKTKYKRSVVGVLWSFLNPLLTMIIQYIVFSTIFKANISNYPVYLLTGIVMFNYFSEACGMTLTSILSNASLITKVYVPKYIYPLSRVLSSAVNLLISLIPLMCVVVFTGVTVTPAYLLIIFPLCCLIVFCMGLGMLLASSMVFFRDTQFLWGVLSMIWMYATPIFYPESILPQQFSFVLKINPLYYFIKFARTCILNGVSPEPMMYVQCALFALGMLAIGAVMFKKSQDKFILYI